MKSNMMYAIFLLVFAALGGIMSGANLQAIFVEKNTLGANWTGLVVGFVTIVMVGAMTFVHPC